MNFFRIESYRRGIAISSVFNFVGKVIGFANSVIVAFYFGTQGKTDVYLYSLATLNIIAAFLTNLNGLVLIPESMRIREQEGLLNSMYFLNWFIIGFALIGAIFSLILLISPVESFIFFSKFDRNLLQENVNVLYCVIPMFTLSVLSSLLSDILVSFKFFTLPMIAGMINSILTIVFVLFFHSRLDILSITFGLLAGIVLNIIILIFLLKKQLHWNFRIARIKVRGLVFKNIIYAQASNITTVLGSYLPIYLISGFNQGIITALNYGKNLSNIPDQFITTQFSSILGIKLNETFALKELDKTNEIFLSSVNILFFILIPIALIISFFSTEIVTILYMRGKFDKHSVEVTSEFLKYFALTLPFLALNTLSSRVLTAGQKMNINFYAGVTLNGFYLLLLYLMIKFIGPIGYPIALLIFLPISVFLANYFIFKKYFSYLKYIKVVIQFGKILLFNIIIGIPFAYLFYNFFTDMNLILSISIVCFLFICSLLIGNHYLKLNIDIILLQKKLISLIRRNG
jgi:putative peptidoglycan lipid II flippase